MKLDNHNNTSIQRIDYIDALKGFLILSVVMCHVAGFCIGIQSDIPSFQHILFEIRNPPFFFISGFFAHNATIIWNKKSLYDAITKKFRTIAWPTMVFLATLVYIQPSCNGHALISYDIKCLWFHWFTLSLFLFFVFYYSLEFCIYQINKGKMNSLILLLIGSVSYFLFSIPSVFESLPFTISTKELLGMRYWGFFFFFSLGILARKHYILFTRFLNNSYVIGTCVLLFLTFNVFYNFFVKEHFTLFQIMTYLTGIIIVLCFFKTFPLRGFVKNVMTFVGKRTLDIYLIHYLLLPLSLYNYTSALREMPMPILEFFITLSISIVIIAMSLLVSCIIRLSPLTAFLLLGDNFFSNRKQQRKT